MGFYFMQTGIDQTRLAVLGCALSAAFPVLVCPHSVVSKTDYFSLLSGQNPNKINWLASVGSCVL